MPPGSAARFKWGLDAYYGSDYEVVDGIFTGRILNHIGDKGKITCLRQYCATNNLRFSECVAVGDGLTDIPLFDACGASIAINASAAAAHKASFNIDTDDLTDIMQFI